jgi:hypothetical protein
MYWCLCNDIDTCTAHTAFCAYCNIHACICLQLSFSNVLYGVMHLYCTVFAQCRTAFGLYLEDPVLWCTNAFGAVNGVVQVACCLLLPNTDVSGTSVTDTAVTSAAVPAAAECEPLCCCECGAVQFKPLTNGNCSSSSSNSTAVMHPSSSVATFALSPVCSEAVVLSDSVCISSSSSELELSSIAAAASSSGSIAAYADVPLTPTRAAVTAAAGTDNAV